MGGWKVAPGLVTLILVASCGRNSVHDAAVRRVAEFLDRWSLPPLSAWDEVGISQREAYRDRVVPYLVRKEGTANFTVIHQFGDISFATVPLLHRKVAGLRLPLTEDSGQELFDRFLRRGISVRKLKRVEVILELPEDNRDRFRAYFELEGRPAKVSCTFDAKTGQILRYHVHKFERSYAATGRTRPNGPASL